MQLLPEGFVLPPLPYLVGILLVSLVIVGVLYRRAQRITEQIVVGLAPWMGVGAGLYALEQARAIPAVVAPFASAPTVYLTTFAVVGTIVAVVGDRHPDRFAIDSTPGVVLITGTVVAVGVFAIAAVAAVRSPPVHVFWPGVAVAGATAIAGGGWLLFRSFLPTVIDETGRAGLLVIFGHALDGLSTAVGLAFLGFGEQTPLSQLLIDIGGVGLFVVVKVFLAVVIVGLLADYVREEPSEGNLLLAAIAAVGLGPGVHNVVLFTIVG
ncbi:DUF63 family protein [Halocatena pleomorpha]|nr:DUF63 family protein [Halocatena pleomorpha]